jgi:hypothetical protein
VKEYVVVIPIAGQMSCTVEAESKEAAKEAAWALYNEGGPDEFTVEWDAYDKLVSGNVLHAPCNSVEVDET